MHHIYSHILGGGKRLVLIHGWNHSHLIWSKITPFLENRYKIAPFSLELFHNGNKWISGHDLYPLSNALIFLRKTGITGNYKPTQTKSNPLIIFDTLRALNSIRISTYCQGVFKNRNKRLIILFCVSSDRSKTTQA